MTIDRLIAIQADLYVKAKKRNADDIFTATIFGRLCGLIHALDINMKWEEAEAKAREAIASAHD